MQAGFAVGEIGIDFFEDILQRRGWRYTLRHRKTQALGLARPMVRILSQNDDTHLFDPGQMKRTKPVTAVRVDDSAARFALCEPCSQLPHVGLGELGRRKRAPGFVHLLNGARRLLASGRPRWRVVRIIGTHESQFNHWAATDSALMLCWACAGTARTRVAPGPTLSRQRQQTIILPFALSARIALTDLFRPLAARSSSPAGALSAALIAAVATATMPTRASAQAACPIVQPDERFALSDNSTPNADGSDTAIIASAERILTEDNIVSLLGGAELAYQDTRISAGNAQYNTDTGEVSISGDLTLAGEGIELSSNTANFDLDDDRFALGETRYRVNVDGNRATGDATGMRGEPEGLFVLEGATYSTCPPEKLDWYIRADRLTLNTETGVGVARGIGFRFKGVPVFALPVFSFPIGTQRKTGFLAPALARSNETGLEFIQPWYWNIRPNLDATLTPRLMTRRGLQLQTEARYLDSQGAWTLTNESLNDREFDDRWRSFTRLTHTGGFGDSLRTRIDAATVTDDEYFNDLGNNARLARVTHLERVAEITYEDEFSSASARLQGFQTVDLASVDNETEPDVSDTPYRRVPQIAFKTRSPRTPLGIETSIDGEFVFFDRRDSITGSRLDISPRVSLPLSGNAWFIKPSFSHRITWYGLSNTDEAQPSSPQRTVNTTSVDAGLFFDRVLDSTGSVQTLEPRVFYLNVPFEEQSDIPVFDSSSFDFNFSQLFRENRFSGADRIGDADQLSVALTSRMIDGNSGRERLSAAIGQIYFFDDRRVRLPDETFQDGNFIDTSERSDLVAEISTQLGDDWTARGNLQWNPDRNETVRGSVLLTYRPGDQRLLNLGHRVVNTGTRAETEQLDISLLWPIRDNLRLAGRWNYSLDADISLESLIGIEYDSCCYAVRFAARRYISDDDADHDTTVYLQLVLKGLAPLGQNYGAVVENAILGYRDDY